MHVYFSDSNIEASLLKSAYVWSAVFLMYASEESHEF